jgi:hypothetical protein
MEVASKMRMKWLTWCLVLMMLVANAMIGASGQNSANSLDPEQTRFDAEPDSGEIQVNRPVEIPDSALQVLRDTLTGGTLNCLKSRGTTPEQAPASWFLASAVHLNGPNEIDLVVVPNVPNIAKPKNPGGCLLPANGGPFWVLGPGAASGRYGLFLATYAGRLDVLSSRTNGYRDIRTGYRSTVILYKFTVQQYQRAR